MPIRLIALDLDGTLLSDDKTISKPNRSWLHRFAERGVQVALASGRMPSCILPHEEALGLDCDLVAYNGAAVFCKKSVGRKRVYHQPLPVGVAGSLIDFCRERNLCLNLYLDEFLYGLAKPSQRRFSDLYSDRTGAAYRWVADLNQFRNECPSKMLIVTNPEYREAVYAELHARFSPAIHVIRTDPEYIELLHPDVNKGNGLKGLGEALSIPLEAMVAFGDAENDIEMVSTAGLGIAMANGAPRTRAAARRVSCFTNQEDGVAKELERLYPYIDCPGDDWCGDSV